ncbi:MAG TPA: hypothetical protein G4O16_02165 [Dehalococcoidia bacterium]|nr:hypothetical protein [Dehalococcoidia bacterium]
MKKLVMAVPIIIVMIALVAIGCSNKGLVGPEDEEELTNSCVDCHTDKALLQELAVVEEEIVSEETTGEG